MKKVRIQIRGDKKINIYSAVVISLISLLPVFLMIFFSVVVGAICLGIFVLPVFCLYLVRPYFVTIDEYVKETSLFGIVRKKKKFSQLKSIKIKYLGTLGHRTCVLPVDYYILNFSDKNHDYEYTNDYFGEDDTIIFETTFKSAEVLRKYMHFLVGESEMQFYAFGELLVNANDNFVCAMTDRTCATVEYKRWGNLKRVKTVNLKSASGMYEKYYLLNFTDEPKEYETLDEARKDADIIVLDKTEQVSEFLEKYIGKFYVQ